MMVDAFHADDAKGNAEDAERTRILALASWDFSAFLSASPA